MYDDINEKLAKLTAEQSKALAEAMNAVYNDPQNNTSDDKDDEPNENIED